MTPLGDAACANCDAPLFERAYAGGSAPYCRECQSWWDLKKLPRLHRFRKPKPEGAVVSLVFEPNGTDHNDLVLRIGKWAHRSDSYYYVLDHPAKTCPDPVSAMRALLVQWQASVGAAAIREAVYLPHAFSDQSTGWLQCRRISEGEFEIVAGWSQVEGWSIYPSDYGQAARGMKDFKAYEEIDAFEIHREKFLMDIEASKHALQA